MENKVPRWQWIWIGCCLSALFGLAILVGCGGLGLLAALGAPGLHATPTPWWTP